MLRHSCKQQRTARAAALAFTVAATLVATAVPGAATGGDGNNHARGAAAQQQAKHARDAHKAVNRSAATTDTKTPDGDALEVADRAAEYANERSAPGTDVSAAALVAARAQAAAMPRAHASATEVTTTPYNAEPPGYTDPVWSNAGAGFQIAAGRMTALAADGHDLYAGAADGGVWRSGDAGRSWTPLWENQDSLSIGAVTTTADHAVWVGTGEANTNSDSYRGVGVFRSTNRGAHFTRVGGDELLNHQVYRLRSDGQGWMYAATSQGLYRHSDSTSAGAWQLVLKPDPNPTGSPYHTSMITDVVIRPGSHGQTVLAVNGWRNGTSDNGFYLSTTGGANGSYTKITPAGDIDATDIGRTTLEYAADGSRLSALRVRPITASWLLALKPM